ncbi:hypothetical protein Rsub_02092 [Raphidocelis subcapitata]|uniref:Uncharacterized protein n=1 Tax=Raphidocelis subcapitata TaxID=307507 RepID=A0A2V0NVC7_9CHLO|nr:hypothetical protein Rsub_02092 [Raphidocelis subcapitata]|eukprot:GBF89520.1 hypothetical protein Rsub_02092 [Raphidocelis subcapitata]
MRHRAGRQRSHHRRGVRQVRGGAREGVAAGGGDGGGDDLFPHGLPGGAHPGVQRPRRRLAAGAGPQDPGGGHPRRPHALQGAPPRRRGPRAAAVRPGAQEAAAQVRVPGAAAPHCAAAHHGEQGVRGRRAGVRPLPALQPPRQLLPRLRRRRRPPLRDRAAAARLRHRRRRRQIRQPLGAAAAAGRVGAGRGRPHRRQGRLRPVPPQRRPQQAGAAGAVPRGRHGHLAAAGRAAAGGGGGAAVRHHNGGRRGAAAIHVQRGHGLFPAPGDAPAPGVPTAVGARPHGLPLSILPGAQRHRRRPLQPVPLHAGREAKGGRGGAGAHAGGGAEKARGHAQQDTVEGAPRRAAVAGGGGAPRRRGGGGGSCGGAWRGRRGPPTLWGRSHRGGAGPARGGLAAWGGRRHGWRWFL